MGLTSSALLAIQTMKNKGILLAFLLAPILMGGCVSATATRTTKEGVAETVKVSSFLSKISNGVYTNGSGVSLSVTDATPDQQSIALLAEGVVKLGAQALALAAKVPTNSVSTNSISDPSTEP
jgi:hypothetical protein